MSIKNKIIFPSVIINILICVVVAVLFCSVMKREMVEVGAMDALYVADKAGAEVEGSIVEKLKVGGEESAAYRRILKALQEVQEGASVAAMYTLYTDGEKVYYGVSTSPNPPLIGDVYAGSCKDLKKAFEGESLQGKELISQGNAYTITSYIPVENKTGEIVGLIACDYDANNIMSALQSTIIKTVLIGIICICISVILITLIAKRVLKNLNTVDRKICDIVEDHGDLTQTIQIKTGDETEKIANHVNELLRYMHGIMTNIADNSNELNVSSENVALNLRDTQEQLSDVATVMIQMGAAMEETSASISGIDDLLKQVYVAIKEIFESSNDGSEMTNTIQNSADMIKKEAVEERNQAVEYFEELQKRVGEKIEQSKTVENIGSLTDEIIAMTKQTNLLSLNASIEAARAGEVGRGFAVVASEIGKLASDSANAASKIEEVSRNVITAVEELAQEAQEMIDFMNGTTAKCYDNLVVIGENYSSDSSTINQMMQKFREQAKQLKENMDHIGRSVSEVNSAVEESTKGINSISEVSGGISNNVTRIEEQANANLDISNRLRAEVNKFKL